MEETIKAILKENGLFVTPVRREVLKLFLEAGHALAHANIEEKCKDITNRMSIYRTLQNFLKKEIIHTIPTTDNSMKYALTKSALKER